MFWKNQISSQQSVRQKNNFEVSTDLSQVNAWVDGIPEQEPARTVFLFTRFIPYFDAGILFEDSMEPGFLVQLSGGCLLSFQKTTL